MRNEGGSAGQIGVSGNTVNYAGTQIGAINATDDGVDGASLVIDLNASATIAAVDADPESHLRQHVRHAHISRTIQIVVDDGDGGTSSPDESVVIDVSAQERHADAHHQHHADRCFVFVEQRDRQHNLSVTDADNTAAQVTFTLVTTPARGSLTGSAALLAPSDTFTQADNIDNNQLAYSHTAADSNDDAFQFTVSDGAGGAIWQHHLLDQVDGVEALKRPHRNGPASADLPARSRQRSTLIAGMHTCHLYTCKPAHLRYNP
ncbi:MAG: cadherin-like domain-containing protein [Caldilineaceae bacterium]